LISIRFRHSGLPAHAFDTSLGYALHGAVPDYHADAEGLGIFGKKL